MSSATSDVTKTEVVRAGAGAGKTTNLIERITEYSIQFHSLHGRWPRIVVTTFTRKATQELKERLLEKANQIGSEQLSSYFSSKDLFISTIHGVLSLFLRNQSHNIDLDPQFSVAETGVAKFRSKQIAREVVFDNPEASKLLESFSFEHIAHLLAQYEEVKSECKGLKAVDFETLRTLQKQAYKGFSEDLSNAARSVLELVEDEKWVAYAQELKKYSELYLLDEPLDGSELLERLSLLGSKPRASKKIDTTASENLKAALDKVKKELAKSYYVSASWQESLDLIESFQKVAEDFSERLLFEKWQKGYLEMSDLELQAARLLEEKPKLFADFGRDWDFWLIDEFQDTSPIQERILSALIGKSSSYVVGDPQQSIYLFRGADSSLFENKQKQVEDAGSFKLLTKNYRSRPELLLFFNDFFEKLGSQFQAMRPRVEDTDSKQVVAKFVGFEEGDKPDRELCERRAVLSHIEGLVARGVNLDSICVLARKNSELKKIAQALSSLGYATYVNSAGSFSERREIIDAVSLLKFLVNPHDNENLFVLLRTPMCRIEDKTLAEWLREFKGESVWKEVRDKEHPVVSLLESLRGQLNEKGLYEVFEKALVDLHFFDLSHYHDATGRRESNLWKLVSTLRLKEKEPGFNPLSFCQQLQSRSVLGDLDEGDAVAALEPNAIQLMTIHASKGLQFDHIVLSGFHKAPSLSSKRFQSSKLSYSEDHSAYSFAVPVGEEQKLTSTLLDKYVVNKFSEKELLEHERLLYVALTRAKESVLITWSGPAETNSWLASSSWNFSAGTHEAQNYSYQCVIDELPPEVRPLAAKKYSVTSVQPFAHEGEALGSSKFSVSRLLSEYESKPDVKVPSSNEKSDVSGLTFLLQSSSEGQQIHGLLEDYSFDMSQDLETLIEKRLPRKKEKALKAMNYMLSVQDPPIKQLLADGASEWVFNCKPRKGLLEGQIDLWGIVDGTVWVVDYKTGSEKYKQSAVDQLNLYSLVFRKMKDLPIKLAVVYPYGEKAYVYEAEPESEIYSKYEL